MVFFLVTAGHHTGEMWFRDEDDFNYGMNLIAVLSCKKGIDIIAFVLMSNHVHIIVACDCRDAALEFIITFKQRLSSYIRNKYGVKEFLRGEAVDIREIETANGSLERAVAYVQMNPVAANICQYPALYPWGTGMTFFNPFQQKGIQIGSLSLRKQMSLLKSKFILPSEYIITEWGFISPVSYVKYKEVESLFRSPKRYNYILSNSSKVKAMTRETGFAPPAFRDQSIRSAMGDLCNTLFQKSEVETLTPEQTAILLSQLRRRFSASVNQLARVTGISSDKISIILDS